MKKFILLVSIALISFSSCKKAHTGGCWECKDASGNALQTVCADSEQQAFDNSGTMNGTHDINTFRTYCKKK